MSGRLGNVMTFPRRHPARAAAALALAALLVPVLWEGVRAWHYRQHRRAAEAESARYNFEEAGAELAECLRLRPRDAGLRLLAARAARRAGQLDEAEDLLDAYDGLGPKVTPEGTLERRLLRAERGEMAAVGEYLTSCLDAHHPDSELILEALALGEVQVYHLGPAMGLLQELIRRQPGNVRALVARGLMLESVGQRDEAIACYRQGVEHNPGNNGAELRLAEGLRRRKDYAEAAEHFERLRGRRPHDPEVLVGLARCWAQLDRFREARQVLDELLARGDEGGIGLLERGKLAMQEGQPAEAEGWLRKAVAAFPSDAGSNYQLALCLERLGKAGEAEAYHRRRREVEADMKQLQTLYPKTLHNPSDPAPRLEAGLICLRNGQPKEALRWFEGALQADPQHRPTHQALADFYERQGDGAEAEKHRRLAGGSARP
ncbi:MAG TPA: tetratricopeptide repeat protein [Gemmataceae bacterium]|nr:tetratricopeptide repeat protein [Gemmataceae bacterium]